MNEVVEFLNRVDQTLLALVIIGLMILPVLLRLKIHVSPLVAIVLFALIIRIPHMEESFWYDESFSAAVARVSFDELPHVIIADVHPPGYYWLLWHMAQSSNQEWWLRLPALLSSLVSIVMMFHITKHLTKSELVAITAALITALLPAHIRYSTEARAYMTLLLLVQIGFYAVLTSRRRLLMVSIVFLPLVNTHGYLYAAVLVLLGFHRWIWIAAIPGALWLPFVLYQISDVTNGFWLQPVTFSGLFRPFILMTVGANDALSVLLLPVGAAAFIYGVWLLKPPRLVWVVAVGVPAAAAAISVIGIHVYLDRALMGSVLLIVIPVLAFAVWNSPEALRIGAAALIVTAFMGYQSQQNKIPIDDWINQCEGDVIYTVSTSTAILSKYYAGGRRVYLMEGANDLSQQLPSPVKDILGLVQIEGVPFWHDSICVVEQRSPYSWTKENERALESILFYQHNQTIHFSDEAHHYEFITYEVELNEPHTRR